MLQHQKNTKNIVIAGTLAGGALASLAAFLPLKAAAYPLNPCPGIYYEEPFNSTRVVPQGCPANAATQRLLGVQAQRPVGILPGVQVPDGRSYPVQPPLPESLEAAVDARVVNNTNRPYFNQNVSIDDVGDNLAAYFNQQVTIRSEVNRTSNPYFFLLDDEDGLDLFGLDLSGTGIDLPIVDVSDDKLLVFNPSGVSNLPDEDGEVLVTGVIRPFVRADVERQYGVALDSSFYAEYESEPVLFAQSVAYAPDPGDVTADPAGFYGQVIAVEGNVENIYSSFVFSLSDQDLFDGQDLLVLNDSQGQLPQRDGNVVVVGEVRRFTMADMQRNYGLGNNSNVPDNRMAEYTRRPVLIVREIYPAAE